MLSALSRPRGWKGRGAVVTRQPPGQTRTEEVKETLNLDPVGAFIYVIRSRLVPQGQVPITSPTNDGCRRLVAGRRGRASRSRMRERLGHVAWRQGPTGNQVTLARSLVRPYLLSSTDNRANRQPQDIRGTCKSDQLVFSELWPPLVALVVTTYGIADELVVAFTMEALGPIWLWN